MKKSWRFSLAGGLVLVLAAWTVLSLSQAQPKSGNSVVATYAHGTLHVSIPYDAPRDGTGILGVEVPQAELHAAGKSAGSCP